MRSRKRSASLSYCLSLSTFYFALVECSLISAFRSIADNQWSKSTRETSRIQRKLRRLRSDRTAVWTSIGSDYRSSLTRFGHRFARCAVNIATYPVDRISRSQSKIEDLLEKLRKNRRVDSAGCSQMFFRPLLFNPWSWSRFLVGRRKFR